MSDRSKSPNGTLTAAWDEHTAEEFVHKDVDATPDPDWDRWQLGAEAIAHLAADG